MLKKISDFFNKPIIIVESDKIEKVYNFIDKLQEEYKSYTSFNINYKKREISYQFYNEKLGHYTLKNLDDFINKFDSITHLLEAKIEFS